MPLSNAEYNLYTSSLNDITDKRMSISVREVRAWLRGIYSHIPASSHTSTRVFASEHHLNRYVPTWIAYSQTLLIQRLLLTLPLVFSENRPTTSVIHTPREKLVQVLKSELSNITLFISPRRIPMFRKIMARELGGSKCSAAGEGRKAIARARERRIGTRRRCEGLGRIGKRSDQGAR